MDTWMGRLREGESLEIDKGGGGGKRGFKGAGRAKEGGVLRGRGKKEKGREKRRGGGGEGGD